MSESVEKGTKSTFTQANAAWIDYKNQIRFYELCARLFQQDRNFDVAMKELAELKSFIADPNHILGSELTKHGEIAEHFQVNISNARKAIEGLNKEYTFDGVGRTAPEDYMHNGLPVQSKFCNGIKNTLRAVKEHHEKYPNFLSDGGSYDIPKNQWEEIQDLLKRSIEKPSSLSNSDLSVLNAIKDFEKETGLSVSSDVCPAIANYDQVQQGTVGTEISNEEKNIQQRDQEKRETIRSETGPSLQEGAKISGISAATEGGLTFCFCVYRKLRSGKKLQEFDKEDWKEIAKETGFGALKGGIRGASVYVLTNFTKTPATLASAYTTATIGVASQFAALQRGSITTDEFIINSEVMCLDIAVSTIFANFGKKIIPVPILGSVIGTIVGETLLGLCQKYAEKEEVKLIEAMNRDLECYVSGLDTELQENVSKLSNELNQFIDMSSLAFDPDPNFAFFGSANLAYLGGVPEEKILWTQEDIDDLFLK